MLAASLAAAFFIPAGLFATSITISEVVAERDAGRLAITIKGDAMIDPESVSTKIGEGYLYLFVHDARVREANRAWKNGAAEGGEDIRAHRHRQKVELAVPLGDGGCQGPVELEKMPGGLRALVGCDEAPRPATGRVLRAEAAPSVRADRGAEARLNPPVMVAPPPMSPLPRVPTPARKPALLLAPVPTAPARTIEIGGDGQSHPRAGSPAETLGRMSDRDGLALKAKLALEPTPTPTPTPSPPPPATPTSEASTHDPVKALHAVTTAPTGAPAPAATGETPASVHPAASAILSPVVAAAVPVAAVRPANTPMGASGSASGAAGSGGIGVVLAGLLLVGMAAAAFYFSRRRAVGVRHIRILETTSIGPKRAIIVARIGDATMVLGSSEAGITLLQTMPEPSADAARVDADAAAIATFFAGESAAIAAATPDAQSDDELDIEESVEEPVDHGRAPASDANRAQPVGQAGLLARLFHRGQPANDSPVARFEDLLEDSLEDQDLRRKLSMGLSGRVR